MLRGFYDLMQSERGTWCVIVLVTTTAIMISGRIDASAWVDMIKYLTMILVASKTVTTAVETRTLGKPQIPTAQVVSQETDKG